MFHKKLKQMGAWLLAFSMVLGSAQLPAMEAEAQDGIDAVVASITAPSVSEGDEKIAMPEVQDGITVRFCADYEQVIGEDGTIYTPLEDKVVKGFYEVSDGTETKKTQEYTVTVPGQYTDDETVNAKPAVIPELQEWHGESGNFVAKTSGRIVYGEGLEATAKEFASDYKEITGRSIPVAAGTAADVKAGDYFLTLGSTDAGLGKEGYRIDIDTSVNIEAADATGAYWGAITVLQILKQNGNYIPKGEIRDYPKYEVRGFMLDVGRKAFDFNTVKEFAKNMSWYKMNSFHLHLSDNLIFHEDYSSLQEAQENSYAGFRLESSLEPEEGSMVETLHSQDTYYTKDEFRSFIKDSRVMGLNIVPEFDMPAHALPITRAFPSLQSTTVSSGHGWLIEELDLTQIDAATELAENIWNDYFTDYDGNGPVFDEETTVHIGTDEFHAGNHEGTQVQTQQGKELFRQFSANLISFIQGKGRTVRMWGSLSNKSGSTPVPSEGVQLNIWNTGYANPQNMYNMGYELINTLEGSLYIVPSAGYYSDYLAAENLYNNWVPNNFGGTVFNAGDDQILGGCYAIWNDQIGTRKNGITELDDFDRFFQPLPSLSSKMWGEADDMTFKEMREVVDKVSTAPGTNPYYEVETNAGKALDYSFDAAQITDASGCGNDAVNTVNATITDGKDGKGVKLNGGESYVETPLTMAGPGSSVSMWVKRDADSGNEEQILLETSTKFNTYAIKAVQKDTGKVGFSREGCDFSFNYTLPEEEWVYLTIKGYKDSAELYVNNELVSTATMDTATKTTGTKVATLVLPLQRIGSKTNSFKGLIDGVTVETESAAADSSYLDMLKVPQSELTAEACSQANEGAGGGSPAHAIDGLANTYWHSNWSTDIAKDNDLHTGGHWFQLTLTNPTVIDRLTYLPRQDNKNGRIYTYDIEITDAQGNTKTVVTGGTWADDATEKTATFDPVEAKSVKLYLRDSAGNDVGVHGTIAELNLYRPASKENCGSMLEPYEQLQAENYVAETWAPFEAVLKKAQAASTDSSVDIDGFLEIMGELSAAKAALKEVDSSYLAGKLDEAANMDVTGAESKYADALNAAIAAIEKELEEKVPTPADIANAVTKLDNAKAVVELSKVVQKSVTLDGMTAESVNAYHAALAAAKAVLQNTQATKEECQKAMEALNKATAGLTVDTTPKPDPTPVDPTPVVPSVPAKGKTVTVKDVQYKVTKSDAKNGTVAAVKLLKKSANKITIPSTVTIDGYTFKVTAVNAKVFQNAKKLAAVTVGANVTKIGSKAFYKCAKLKKVTFKGVKAPSIGKQAFKGTAAKCKVTAPKKMAKKQKNLLKTRLKKAGLSKKAVVK